MCYIYRSLGPSVENRSPTRPIFFLEVTTPPEATSKLSGATRAV